MNGRFDVIVVGSGAAGGMAVYDLCHAGLKVLLIEAGRDYKPATETPMFQTPELAPLRASGTPDKPSGFYDATIDGGWSVPGEPYEVGSGAFNWWRPRMLGGRTNHWGRVALRYGAYDFKPFSRDGLGVDWPIAYEDVAPWYERVERLIGVTGAPHGYENTPDSLPGTLLPPPPLRAHELVLSAAFRKLNMPIAAIHAAVLTRPLNGRPACSFATQCTRGCSSGSNFQSTTVLIPDAYATGNLTIQTNALVERVDVGEDNRATGVTFVERTRGTIHSVEGSAVVLAAGAFSSVRILLNSRSVASPQGLGNSRGLVGKYIMDSVEFTMQGHIPALERLPPQNDDGIFTPHIYVPWWLYQAQADGKLDFPRGYHIEPRGGRRLPSVAIGGYVDADDPTFGVSLRETVHRKYGSFVFLTGEGEMIPNENTFCELHDKATDKWGWPILNFHWNWGQSEVRQVAHMQTTFQKIFALLGGTDVTGHFEMPVGGGAIHEVGGARMGFSPEDSVVDQYGRCWEAKNLFVLDGAVFSSSADKNPTLTILALASRGAHRIIELKGQGSL